MDERKGALGKRPRTWQQAERRALVADLVRTQSTLQARSEQLQEIFASRWYRLARFTWRLRRGSIFRKASPPRMAGEDSFSRPLDGDPSAVDETEVRLVPAPAAPSTPANGIEVDLERRRWLAEARAPGLGELRVAAILDEGTEACLAPECALDTDFGAGEWRERLEARPPHLLLVESARAGNGGGWSGAVGPDPGSPLEDLPALRELVAWCRERDIPSAFWATRDPLEFDRFAGAAALCDHVFTVDADRIGDYRELPGVAAGSVSALPPATQPRLHNPVYVRSDGLPLPAYAGGFERGWPAERFEALVELLDAASNFGLVIYETGEGEAAEDRGFPARFMPKIEGRLSYRETLAAYKRHPLFVCAAAAGESPTAVPRQVFELLACGTPVLSMASPAIEQIFGDLVPTADGQDEAIDQLERLLGDREERRELAMRGQRLVLGAHTYRDRLGELVEAVGFDLPPDAAEETAALVAVGEGDELGDAVDALLEQSLAPSEVLIGLAGRKGGERSLERLRERFPETRIRTLTQAHDVSHSDQLRELARLAAAAWVAPIAPTLRYDRHHLRDLVACTRFAEAQVIGFSPAGATHRYTEAVPPYAALATRGLVAERGWPRDDAAMRRWFAEGIRIYAGERGGGVAGDDDP